MYGKYGAGVLGQTGAPRNQSWRFAFGRAELPLSSRGAKGSRRVGKSAKRCAHDFSRSQKMCGHASLYPPYETMGVAAPYAFSPCGENR